MERSQRLQVTMPTEENVFGTTKLKEYGQLVWLEEPMKCSCYHDPLSLPCLSDSTDSFDYLHAETS